MLMSSGSSVRSRLLMLAAAATSGVAGSLQRAKAPTTAAGAQSRLDELASQLQQQTDRIAQQDLRLADLERVAPKEFEVLHYNVLAEQFGSNLQPWFCYGADVTLAERSQMTSAFYATDATDGFKLAADKGWPRWAEGVLSPERMAAIEAYDARFFSWKGRCERLWEVVRSHRVGCRVRSPDIVTLAECDRFDDFWEWKFNNAGYGAVWRKRPRDASRDGCAIAWRRSTFDLVASGGFDFGASLGEAHDRTCAFALLRWRRDPSVRLLVATTHLARNPESTEQVLARGFQYGTIFRELLAFAGEHDAEEVPVVLTGDLNTKDCDELAGIARTLIRLTSAPTHPLLWSVMDAPTPPTTITEERTLRIDYVLYQSSQLSLTGVGFVPRLRSPIPDATHPSDHLPVSARLVFIPHWAQVEDARASPHSSPRAHLARASLRSRRTRGSGSRRSPARAPSGRSRATRYAPRSRTLTRTVRASSRRYSLRLGCRRSASRGLTRRRCARRSEVRASTCRTPTRYIPTRRRRSAFNLASATTWQQQRHPDERRPAQARLARRRPGDASWAMNLENFVAAYTKMMEDANSAVSRQLEKAFAAFDPNGDGLVSKSDLREMLRRMATAPLDEVMVDKIVDELSEDADEADQISLGSFSRWMGRAYSSYMHNPALVKDSTAKWREEVYNQ